jgi:hypothetical protein
MEPVGGFMFDENIKAAAREGKEFFTEGIHL